MPDHQPTRKKQRKDSAYKIERSRLKRERREERQRRQKKAKDILSRFDIDTMIEEGRYLNRQFILHIGPTNSGKTYTALQSLKQARTGAYLGPLRLLALEMYDTLNAQGIPCSLLTGEEHISVSNARMVASTIELANLDIRYDAVVIDEAQMIGNPERGAAWTQALLCIDAAVVHVCMAPEAESIITSLLNLMEADYRIERHERLAPLVFQGKLNSLQDIQPGDAVIAFSRRKVLNIAATLQEMGINASVIYGALPPQARREEVARFTDGRTSVIVATDAIGMGISIPIRRIIFYEDSKYDGVELRKLNANEVQQISGRAGRYGIYDQGEVLTLCEPTRVKKSLKMAVPAIGRVALPFPEKVFDLDWDNDIDLLLLLSAWNSLPNSNLYKHQSMSNALALYKLLFYRMGGDEIKCFPKKLIYLLITCPVNADSRDLVPYWLRCCQAILHEEPLPLPDFDTDSLEGCENQYFGYDVRHQLLRRIGIEEPHLEEKAQLCRKINQFLLQSMSEFLPRCSRCGKRLPLSWRYGMCESCYYTGAVWW